MTTLAHALPPDTLDSAAARGLVRLTPEVQRQALLRLLAALDAGDQRRANAYLNALRRCENGLPKDDATSYTSYTWAEWQARFGSGVSASDELGGRAQ